MPPRRLLILFAHPALHKSRVNQLLLSSVESLSGVTINDLYESYPNFHVNVAREQALLLEHDVIVFQHPFYWYSSPAILKQWQDLVLEYGFAFGKNGTRLHGKLALTAISTGGPSSAYQRSGYNYFTVRELLAPFEQTARLCGMTYLPPFVVPGVLWMEDQAELSAYGSVYRRALAALRDHTFDLSELMKLDTLNQAVDLLPAS
ncbi:MAG TPA: NAD(P)H-dependent oxidoreductase [Chthoniobacterales bacterium]|jgi:glutathione-regulated potassium-efflux system ancillary protein KefG|nr:NAD(P)H-dependent oxidoreductase [Chthoniobacterales bacterium]